MSTQRVEDHLRLARCKDRVDRSGGKFPGYFPRSFSAFVAGQTAPPGTPALAVTNPLESDHSNQQPVRHLRRGRLPERLASALSPSRQLHFGRPPILSPARCARVHPALPWVRLALRCRTERYDGKRNLYFQHAA
jgi:hypothetical protein